MHSLFSTFTIIVYGLSFFSLGTIILIYPRRASQFKLAGSLGLVGLFGILHAMNEWIDMIGLLQIREPVFLKIVRMFLLPGSFFCLLQFGAKALTREKPGSALRKIPVLLLAAWAASLFASGGKFIIMDTFARYLLGFPGSFLAAYAFWTYMPEFSDRKRPGSVLAVKVSAGAFIAYGIFTGLIVKRAGFFPASVLNTENFINKTGIPAGLFPIQWARTLCAVALCFSITWILKTFEAETISSLRQSGEALRKSEEFIRDALDSVDEGFIVVDSDLRIMTANRAYCAWNNCSVPDIAGKYCYEVSHNASRPCDEAGEYCAVKKVFETGQPDMALHRHKNAGGEVMLVETKAFPMRDASGAVTSVIETIHNVTERQLLEKERLKSQKLEAIGRLAGGIAHDFNNLLQGVFGYIALAKAALDQKEKKSFANLERAEKALKMSINLTRQLLTFSKGGQPVKGDVALLPIIENAANLALSGSSSECRITADKDLWPVMADEGQIAQVVQNIVLNASDAMPGGGMVEITVGNARVARAGKPLLPDGGKFVTVAVRDTGVGISDGNLSRIFDPYFTTKQKGSGLGLATSYSIISNHGGAIEAVSEAGKGSLFTIYLPAGEEDGEKTDGQETHAASARADGPGQKMKGKVLVMDDDEIVRDVAVKMIEGLGHEVQSADSGEEAIRKFRQAADAGKPFDVVILDLTVRRGMGGEEAVKNIREIDPAVKTIVSSGYSDNMVLSNYRSYGFSAFLNKPYMIGSLRDALDGLLGK